MRTRIVVLLAAILVAPMALAQGTPGTVELTPTVGYWFGDTLGRGVTDAFDFDVTIDDTPMYGLRLGYRFSENWALEGFAATGQADLKAGRGGIFEPSDRFGTMDLTVGEVGFEGSFGHRRLVPFLAGGIGAMHMSPNVNGIDAGSDTRFVGNFGGGFKLFFSPTTALRFDWRGHSVKVGDSNDCDWWDDCDYEDNWITFVEVAVGLTFVF